MLEILCLLVFVICYLYIGLYYLIEVKDIINYFISGRCCCGAAACCCGLMLIKEKVDGRRGRDIIIRKKKEVRSAEEEGECVYVCVVCGVCGIINYCFQYFQECIRRSLNLIVD